eukprot:1101858-Rhodomonas_salina.3
MNINTTIPVPLGYEPHACSTLQLEKKRKREEWIMLTVCCMDSDLLVRTVTSCPPPRISCQQVN